MGDTIRTAAAAVGAGVVTAILLWPTSNCISTLAQALPGQPDPTRRTCQSVIGLPANTAMAVLIWLLVATVVYVTMRRRAR